MKDVSPDKYNEEMERRFCLVPILAVVIAHRHPWMPNSVAGILTPYAGTDLEIIVRDGTDLSITVPRLRDLVSGVYELWMAGVQHGDIKHWNTVINEDGKLMLIDAGTEAPDYDGDASALAKLLLWCVGSASSLRNHPDAKKAVVTAACALAQGNFDNALNCLV